MIRKSVIAVAVVASISAGFGVSVASANNVVLCANKKTEVVRYSSTGKCRAKTETRLALGVTGPAGAAGAAGSYATAQTVMNIATQGYSLVLADAGKMITSSVNTEITIPADATVAFPIGTRIDIGRLASYIWVRGATGVTINGTSFESMDSVSYQHGLLVKTAANTWVLLRFFA
jgi:hypothetical protein